MANPFLYLSSFYIFYTPLMRYPTNFKMSHGTLVMPIKLSFNFTKKNDKIDSTRKWLKSETDSMKKILIIFLLMFACRQAHAVTATGGTVTNYTLNGTNYRAHIFTTVGNTNLVVSAGGEVEYLVVAGGGGGGSAIGGGGGAGGLRTGTTNVVATNYAITVGRGGAPQSFNQGEDGKSSAFSAITATGGGGGGLSIRWITGLTPSTVIATTVGAGSTGTGGTSSFSTFCSATGGLREGGMGSGGDLNSRGTFGSGNYNACGPTGQAGGASFFGGGSSTAGNNPVLGGGGSATGGNASAGAPGVIVVEWIA